MSPSKKLLLLQNKTDQTSPLNCKKKLKQGKFTNPNCPTTLEDIQNPLNPITEQTYKENPLKQT